MFERRWVVRCDHPQCDEVLICPRPNDVVYGDDKGNAGIYAADCFWDVRPNRRETYCRTHAREEISVDD